MTGFNSKIYKYFLYKTFLTLLINNVIYFTSSNLVKLFTLLF